jgi:hypothetical protein
MFSTVYLASVLKVGNMKKRGFFFTMDALLAIGIIVMAFLFILSSYTSKPIETQTIFFSEDLLSVLANVKITDVSHDDVFRMWCDECNNATHEINRPDNTVMEQLAEFCYVGKADRAAFLAERMVDNLVNPQHSVEIFVIGKNFSGDHHTDIVYKKNSTLPLQMLQNASRALITSKRLLYGIIDSETLYGPYTVEVRVWQ